MHILNLCTPITPARHSNHALGVRKVDITGSSIRDVLNSLAETEKASDLEPEVERDILVKVSAPVHVRIIPPTALIASVPATYVGASQGKRSTSDFVDNFMSNWTRLVGDPILSKWIVVFLAISISLNGYLLKGIAAGLSGKGGIKSGGVRFSGDEKEKEKDTKETEVAPAPRIVQLKQPVIYRAPPPASVAPTFTLSDVDRKLKARRATITAVSGPTPSSSASSASEESDALETVRSLEQCIDIFDNGPRPLSLSLSLLNDEEIILLSQNGKIAAYALEKLLGPDELERAVRIRRALVCEYLTSTILLSMILTRD